MCSSRPRPTRTTRSDHTTHVTTGKNRRSWPDGTDVFCARVGLCSDSRHRHRRVFAQPSRLRGVYFCGFVLWFCFMVSFYGFVLSRFRRDLTSLRCVWSECHWPSTRRNVCRICARCTPDDQPRGLLVGRRTIANRQRRSSICVGSTTRIAFEGRVGKNGNRGDAAGSSVAGTAMTVRSFAAQLDSRDA